MEPHFIQFILRTEAMTAADRRLADEQLGRMAHCLWQLSRGAVEGWRRLTRASRRPTGGATRPAACVPAGQGGGTRRTAR
jgi:hypothetical protein